jgi:hypothetical protein
MQLYKLLLYDHDHGDPSYNRFFFVICLFYEKQRQIYEQFILGINKKISQTDINFSKEH